MSDTTTSFTLTSPLPSFIYKHLTQTTSSENIQNIFNTQCNWWPFVLLSAITAITLMALVIHLYRKLNNNNHTQILLEITNGLSCVVVPIVTLPLCPTDWDIIIPDNLSNMRISGTCFARLHAQWPGFSITGINTKHVIPIPEDITIIFYTALKLRKIFKTPFFCHILLTHQLFK